MSTSAVSRSGAYNKLLTFVDTTRTYQPDRLFGLLPSEGSRDICLKDPHTLTAPVSQGSSRPRRYYWVVWVATRMRWRYTLTGYTTISKRKSEHSSCIPPNTELTCLLAGTAIASSTHVRPKRPRSSSLSFGFIFSRGYHLPLNHHRAPLSFNRRSS